MILLFCLIIYLIAFYNHNKKKDLTYAVLTGPQYDPYHDEMLRLIEEAVRHPFQEVFIESYDRKRLYARYFHVRDGAPLEIMFHGYQGNGFRDFSGGLSFALDNGFNALLVDERGQGRSEGHTMTFGIKERLDVLSWVEYANRRFGKETPIYLVGISMGAATVLMASELELPANVKGIFADCPYSSPIDILVKVGSEIIGLKGALKPFFAISAFVYGHFNVFASSAVKAVQNAKIPIAVIHGTSDLYVPCEMSRAIREANPRMVELTEVEGAPHGLSFLVDFQKYEACFQRFMDRCNS